MELKFKKLSPAATLPTYGTKGAACFDLYALESGVVPQGGATTARTGLAVEVPEGHAMMIYSRSGHGFKNGVRLSNGTGVIDSDYRGEIMVRLHNDGQVDYEVQMGERIAQAMVIPVLQVQVTETDELGQTERGEGGFGSTGK